MSNIILTGDTSGTLNLAAPLVAGSNTQTLAAVTGTLAPVVSGTVVTSTSGTVADFTGIPSWVKKITVMFSGVSSNGASQFQVQLGTTSGVETTGYASAGCRPNAVQTSTTGLLVQYDNNSTWTTSGILTIGLIGSNSWTSSGTSYSETGSLVHYFAGRKALAGTLDRVRFTTINGTDTFDAGTINILYE